MAAYDAADIAAQSTPGNDTELQKYDRDFHREYIRENRFFPYMGDSKTGSVIVRQSEAVAAGNEVNVPLVQQLRGGRKGLAPLVGKENTMYADTMKVRPVYVRDAVTIRQDQRQKSFIDLLKARRYVLKDKAKDDLYEMVLEALRSVGLDPTLYDLDTSTTENILYENATGAQLDQWNADNPFRVVYGLDNQARTAGAHATSIAALGAGDGSTADMIRSLKAIAQARNFVTGPTARTALTPTAVRKGRGDYMHERYVLFCGTKPFNGFATDAEIKEAYAHASRTGETKNRIFQGGDCILFDDVIIKKIPEMDEYEPSATVGKISFCGAGAFAMGEGEKYKSTKRMEDDYQSISGVGYQQRFVVQKTMFRDKHIDADTPPLVQHGVIDAFVKV